MQERMTMRALLADFRDTLDTDRDDILEDYYLEDTLSEYADNAVPVRHSDLLDLAADDNDVALSEPDCGPAYDGTPTPINIIAANVYEALLAEGYEWLQEQRDAADES